jgi:hypothetical protein
MKLIAKIKVKEIWFHVELKPYDFKSPFAGKDYVCVIFNNDPNISIEEQYYISEKIVKSGCKNAMCAGYNCSTWDDSIDEEYLATDVNFDPPDNTFIMTTWHENESIADIIFHMLNCTDFDNHKFEKYLIYLIGKQDFLKRKIQKEIEKIC